MQGPVTLSIVIVNFETPEYTMECIRSIYANAPHCQYEIILIDNGSSDGSLEIIRSHWPEVICIETGRNLGFAKANNLGIANTRGQFVLLLNSDTKLLDNTLDRMLEYLFAHPEAGAIGPRQIDGRGHLQLSWGSFPTFVSEMYRKLIFTRLNVNDLMIREYLENRYAGENDVDWVSGSCLMARKEALKGVNLLDEAFFMYFEDIDLCRRIQDSGWAIRFLSDMTIIHYGGVSAKKNILRVLVEYRRSQIYFTRKYYRLTGVAVLKCMLFLKAALNCVRWSFHFLADSISGRVKAKANSFSNLLLNKKTLELVFNHEPIRVSD